MKLNSPYSVYGSQLDLKHGRRNFGWAFCQTRCFSIHFRWTTAISNYTPSLTPNCIISIRFLNIFLKPWNFVAHLQADIKTCPFTLTVNGCHLWFSNFHCNVYGIHYYKKRLISLPTIIQDSQNVRYSRWSIVPRKFTIVIWRNAYLIQGHSWISGFPFNLAVFLQHQGNVWPRKWG